MAIIGNIVTDYRAGGAVKYSPNSIPPTDGGDTLLPINAAMLANGTGDTLLNEWNATLTVVPPTVAQIGTTIIGIGIDPSQDAPYRETYLLVDSVQKNLVLRMPNGAGIGAPLSYKRISLDGGFNYQDFTLNVRYNDLYISAYLTDGVFHYTYQYTYQSPLSNPVGRIAIKNYGTTRPRIRTFSVASQFIVGPDILFIGDSITAGNGCFPSSTRYANRIKELFEAAGNPQDIQVWASGAARVSDMVDMVNSVIAVQPKKVVILIGDNDNSAAVSAFITTLGEELIDPITNALQIPIVVLAMTPDKNDPHITFQHAILNAQQGGSQILLDTVASPQYLTTVDTLAPLSIGGDVTQPDLTLLMPDTTHLNEAGCIAMADIVYPNL